MNGQNKVAIACFKQLFRYSFVVSGEHYENSKSLYSVS